MADVKMINKLGQLSEFVNDKNIIEIAIRNKNKKFKAFQKIAIDELGYNKEQQKAMSKVINRLNQNYKTNVKNMELLNNVAKLNQLNLLMNGLNLCVTCAGFAIVCHKIDSISDKIDKVLSVVKTAKDLQIDYEFKKCVSEHTIMLDHRKTQDYFSLDEMEKLVAKEHDVLEMIVNHFMSNVINDKGILLYSIMTLASMLSVSLRYYDEMYYLDHKDKINGSEIWHTLHDKWISIFDKIASDEFIKVVQDYGFLELNLTTSGCDAFYINVKDNSLSYKQDVIDNQKLLTVFGDKEVYDSFTRNSDNEVKKTIEELINQDDNLCNDNELKEIVNRAMIKIGIVN